VAKVIIRFGEDTEVVLEDEQSAAKLLLAMKASTQPSVERVPLRPRPTIAVSSAAIAPPSPVQDAVKKVLTTGPQTTRQLIEKMEAAGFVFGAKDKIIAINSALATLEERGEARVHATVAGTNQKLWVRGGI
jgi:hypothetical protein